MSLSYAQFNASNRVVFLPIVSLLLTDLLLANPATTEPSRWPRKGFLPSSRVAWKAGVVAWAFELYIFFRLFVTSTRESAFFSLVLVN